MYKQPLFLSPRPPKKKKCELLYGENKGQRIKTGFGVTQTLVWTHICCLLLD